MFPQFRSQGDVVVDSSRSNADDSVALTEQNGA